jgi:hypothetical protein
VIHSFLVFAGKKFPHNFAHDLESVAAKVRKAQKSMKLELDTTATEKG